MQPSTESAKARIICTYQVDDVELIWLSDRTVQVLSTNEEVGRWYWDVQFSSVFFLGITRLWQKRLQASHGFLLTFATTCYLQYLNSEILRDE